MWKLCALAPVAQRPSSDATSRRARWEWLNDIVCPPSGLRGHGAQAPKRLKSLMVLCLMCMPVLCGDCVAQFLEHLVRGCEAVQAHPGLVGCGAQQRDRGVVHL